MIQLFHVYKEYEGGVNALADITFKVDKGEFLFITGGSGAGKTTLLEIIFGVESPTDGSIIIEGKNYLKIPSKDIPFLRRKIGFVFQDFKLLPNKTVFENVALALKITGMNPSEVTKRVQQALSFVKLQHRANFKPLCLSGGEQQRVSLARAIVKEPMLLLADEPTGNLDPELGIEMMDIFREISSRGTTVIVATHDKEILKKINKRTITLEKGRVVN